MSKRTAIDAIKKKLTGKSLTYSEIFSVMDEIAHQRLGPILTTYFAAAGFQGGFSDDELYSLTKAMVETGKRLHLTGIVADKHSTGGVAGTRTTMIVVPIVAAAGITIPKNSSRAITSASGTGDTMEALANVTFTVHEIEQLVKKTGGCIVWGGHLGIAPADDVLIQVEEPLAFESFDKVIVSIMAKKVASSATHLVLDLPVGPFMKIKHFKDAEIIADKFRKLAQRFNIKITVDINHTREPAGRGVGPVLEVRDVFQILEQDNTRPLALEEKALRLAGKLLSLCFEDMPERKGQSGEDVAREMLVSGAALSKMREIIKAQGGNPNVSSKKLELGMHTYDVVSSKSGRISQVHNQQINTVARILGSPNDKKAGIYLYRRLEERVAEGETLFTMYSSNKWRMEEAIQTVKHLPVYTVE
ncbi:hypothetical protein A3B56_02525 [Candidatus Roizmanbacteria bacterium RIFCSPLOWO2_01_FULL_45_11]|uniref:Pyrimidine nucleoside phosphorylase C-terminal domain-containing protein n=1 Tax=Candidatus Roizmanbacteria bacterium RIFCSPLOWO2_01_FULL_45_11 TaxID=1802070 RepID=A0A1F7JJ79_9BACT|nr:MAG: hypothetical protein A3B56_02525 [Candidatus Roizmanbacteria bacterium RIFCSPLOWO2_01_FULL_45_11]